MGLVGRGYFELLVVQHAVGVEHLSHIGLRVCLLFSHETGQVAIILHWNSVSIQVLGHLGEEQIGVDHVASLPHPWLVETPWLAHGLTSISSKTVLEPWRLHVSLEAAHLVETSPHVGWE